MKDVAQLRRKIDRSCREFLSRAPVESSTLTLDGTGVNGHIQFLVLKTLGLDVVKRLKRVNLISGSWYTYCAFLAIEEGLLDDPDARMRRWDADNRLLWHATSLLKGLRRIPAIASGRAALYSNECLERMLRGTASDTFAERRVDELPANVAVWLYSLSQSALLAVRPRASFGNTRLAELARCCASIPRLYTPGRLGEQLVIDPVFSPAYAELRRRLRDEAGNHLIANVVTERTTENAIWVKPHAFGDGKRMVLADFARMVMNRPNTRIYQAWSAAYALQTPQVKTGT